MHEQAERIQGSQPRPGAARARTPGAEDEGGTRGRVQRGRFRACARRLLCSLTLIAAAALATAAGGEESVTDLPPEARVMPNVDLYPQATLTAEFVDYHTVPFGDAALEFQITARKNWTWHGLSVASKVDAMDFVPLAVISGPKAADAPTIVQVGYRVIEREIDLQDYLDAYAECLGYAVLQGQWCTYSGRVVYEVLARTKARGADALVRLALSRDGRNFFLVSGICATSAYPQLAKDFGVAVVSFRLLHPSGQEYCEEMKEGGFTEPVKASFRYPASWTLETAASAPPGIAVVDLRHGNAEVGTVGWIRVKALARSVYPTLDAGACVENVAEELMAQGFAFGKPRFSGTPAAPEGKFLPGGRVAIYPVTRGSAKSELRVVAVSTRAAWYVLVLLSPERPGAMVPWMINKRAFEIVFETLH